MIILPEALDQIEAQEVYIAENGSPLVAQQFAERLLTRCYEIGGLPYGGSPRDELSPGLRSVPFEQAGTLFYRVTNAEVLVASVLFRGRDPARYFGSAS